MKGEFEIVREISIDAAHRVPLHGSKCKSLHGHRYRIEAICTGALHEVGEQQGMVLDFGFLKDEMITVIDAGCDHGTILGVDDPLLGDLEDKGLLAEALAETTARVAAEGYAQTGWFAGKLYLLPQVPTAENLAQHWYMRLAPRVDQRTGQRAALRCLRVHETPHCSASYPAHRTGPST